MTEPIDFLRRRTWAEIDLSRAEYNFRTIRERLSPDTKLCCVVKANAYGHSAIELGKLYEASGADFLAVSNVEEALQLRVAKIRLPILILGYTPEECAGILARENISQCVFSEEYGLRLAECARRQNVTVKIHIKLDTGMGRIGFRRRDDGDDTLSEIRHVCESEGLFPEGIFTHFASADEGENGKAFSARQFERFEQTVSALQESGITFAIRHCSNSAAVFDYPSYHLDMVRAGVVLYGLLPSEHVNPLPKLRHVMTLYSVISHIKTVFPGDTVSYGRRYTAESKRKIATVPIGYADGFRRCGGDGTCFLGVNGKACPIVGRVCMDQLMIDVTDVPCKVGDRVTIFGDEEPFTPERLAEATDTIGYEIICAVGERVPRVFTRDGKSLFVRDNVYAESPAVGDETHTSEKREMP